MIHFQAVWDFTGQELVALRRAVRQLKLNRPACMCVHLCVHTHTHIHTPVAAPKELTGRGVVLCRHLFPWYQLFTSPEGKQADRSVLTVVTK